MEFPNLDQFISKRNREYEQMIWKAFKDRGYSKEWVIENADRIRIDEYAGSGTRMFKLNDEVIFSITEATRFEENDGRYTVYTEISLTHL